MERRMERRGEEDGGIHGRWWEEEAVEAHGPEVRDVRSFGTSPRVVLPSLGAPQVRHSP